MAELYCARCDRPLQDIHDYQPNDGLYFVTYGHYGSTFFDPMDGSCMEIVVCDDCLRNKVKHRIKYKNRYRTLTDR